MERRTRGIKEKSIGADRDVFELDIAQYKPLSDLGKYLIQGYEDRLFLLRSIVFYPLAEVRRC